MFELWLVWMLTMKTRVKHILPLIFFKKNCYQNHMYPKWNVEQIEMKFMGKNRITKEKYLAEAG